MYRIAGLKHVKYKIRGQEPRAQLELDHCHNQLAGSGRDQWKIKNTNKTYNRPQQYKARRAQNHRPLWLEVLCWSKNQKERRHQWHLKSREHTTVASHFTFHKLELNLWPKQYSTAHKLTHSILEKPSGYPHQVSLFKWNINGGFCKNLKKVPNPSWPSSNNKTGDLRNRKKRSLLNLNQSCWQQSGRGT